ncbi:MAG TPA: glycosyltransferase family 1 protein [Stellaceae bacterium]|nr:glycosyltransferase family 1 protein [Stellaceae bacterium]
MIFIEATALLEVRFTGIPQLTWHLVQYWLEQSDHEVRFIMGNLEIDREDIETLVRHRTGRYYRVWYHNGPRSRTFSAADAKRAVGLYPHTRPMREKQFGREVRIIHDLTGLLTPEFHPAEVARDEGNDYAYELSVIDHAVCVSQATRDDLIRYCGADPAKTSVAYPGVRWFDSHATVYELLNTAPFDRYVLILGTFEPRKNIDLVFLMLKNNPKILEEFTFCFCGPVGWGGIYERCMGDPDISQLVHSGRVRIIPFVDERLKYALMKEASFLIYPSFLEGFGSPVAEALSLGVPVAVSFGGSLPEVAGEAGYYFDPHSVESLEKAVGRLTSDLAYRNAEIRAAAYRQGGKFTWLAFNDAIREVVEELQ